MKKYALAILCCLLSTSGINAKLKIRNFISFGLAVPIDHWITEDAAYKFLRKGYIKFNHITAAERPGTSNARNNQPVQLSAEQVADAKIKAKVPGFVPIKEVSQVVSVIVLYELLNTFQGGEFPINLRSVLGIGGATVVHHYLDKLKCDAIADRLLRGFGFSQQEADDLERKHNERSKIKHTEIVRTVCTLGSYELIKFLLLL